MDVLNVSCLLTGKFQMQVLPQCGHAVHEDAPEKVRSHLPAASCLLSIKFSKKNPECVVCCQVADALATFMVRHKFTEFKEGYLWWATRPRESADSTLFMDLIDLCLTFVF